MIRPPRGAEPSRTIPGPLPDVPSASGPLLVLVAVSLEARRLARRPPAVVRRIGVGAADLPRLSPELAALRPTAVLAVGLAGGCAPDVVPGDIVVGAATGSAGSDEWLVPDPALRQRAVAALGAAGLPHRVGRLLTVPALVAAPEAKADCWRRHGAVAVDMESLHVLRWARAAGLPALAVRAVADAAAEPLPPALLGALDAAGRPRPAAVAGWVVRPGLAASAWRMWRRARIALDRLERFLVAFAALRP